MRRNHSLDAFCQICVHIRYHTLSHTHHIFTLCILCTYKSVSTLKYYPNSFSSLHEHFCSSLISIVFPPLLLDRRVSSKYHPIGYEPCPNLLFLPMYLGTIDSICYHHPLRITTGAQYCNRLNPHQLLVV